MTDGDSYGGLRCDEKEIILKRSDPSHPPLSCRTSPPQGGRWAASATALHLATLAVGESGDEIDLPPCGGDG
ncbi:hypothetical protein FJ424_25085, partial [Mesorhizobium sp. B3-1-8]